MAVPRKRALIDIRCHPNAHWLASLYHGRGGALLARFDARAMLHPVTLEPIATRTELAALRATGFVIEDRPFLGQHRDGSALWFRCRCGAGSPPLSADTEDILDAAAAGHPTTIIAVPTASLRNGREVDENGMPILRAGMQGSS